MEYVTRDFTHTQNIVIPIVVTRTVELPPANSGYYGIIVFTEGITTITDTNTGMRILPAPGIICITPEHNIANITFDPPEKPITNDSSLFCILFRPDGINSTFSDFPDTFEYKAFKKICGGYHYSTINSVIADKLHQLYTDIDQELNVLQGDYWPCLTRSYLLEMFLLIDRIEYEENTHGYSNPQR